MIAAFYNAIGNQNRCEDAYVTYVRLVERFFLKDSLETSNAYFLVGIYYFEKKLSHKAIACFKKTLAIREKKFGLEHASCADCIHNLGILFKQRGNVGHALDAFNQALKIR